MPKPGTGSFFEGFSGKAVDMCRERTRPVVAQIHDVQPQALTQRPEKASVKPPGCPRLPWHLDRKRAGTVQIVIALSETHFLVWPRSHKVHLGSGTAGYYELSKADIGKLPGKPAT